MFSIDFKPLIIDSEPFHFPQEITLTIRRLDKIDSITGGNKWFKLRNNFLRMQKEGLTKIVTFGGTWSNHIAAVARAGRMSGISTTGIIRGESSAIMNNTMKRAEADGMKLIFISRNDYLKKDNIDFVKSLIGYDNQYFIIPEGGANAEGVKGCSEIYIDTDDQYSHIVVACGTGTTAAGIIMKLALHQQLVGLSVLKDGDSIDNNISYWLDQLKINHTNDNWKIIHDFHFGGYAKSTPQLTHFVEEFSTKTGIRIEPVYTGKMFFGLDQMIRDSAFPPGAKILAIHSGGLQYLLNN